MGFIHFLLLLGFAGLLEPVPAISKQRQGSPGRSFVQNRKSLTTIHTHAYSSACLWMDGGRKLQDPETTHADA